MLNKNKTCYSIFSVILYLYIGNQNQPLKAFKMQGCKQYPEGN